MFHHLYLFIYLSLIRYYSIKWLLENLKRIVLHQDHEISMERSKCLERYFEDESELKVEKIEFAAFLGGRFPSPEALTKRWALQPMVWGNTKAPHFQLFKPLPLNFLDNLVHPHVLRGIGAHTNSFIL